MAQNYAASRGQRPLAHGIEWTPNSFEQFSAGLNGRQEKFISKR
jgi:hypothetical protein